METKKSIREQYAEIKKQEIAELRERLSYYNGHVSFCRTEEADKDDEADPHVMVGDYPLILTDYGTRDSEEVQVRQAYIADSGALVIMVRGNNDYEDWSIDEENIVYGDIAHITEAIPEV